MSNVVTVLCDLGSWLRAPPHAIPIAQLALGGCIGVCVCVSNVVLLHRKYEVTTQIRSEE